MLISQRVFIKSFCKRQFPHKSGNLSFIITTIKNKLTDLWNRLQQKRLDKHFLCDKFRQVAQNAVASTGGPHRSNLGPYQIMARYLRPPTLKPRLDILS